MAAPLLAQHVGGGADSYSATCSSRSSAAVAFATIVAVVAGLVLAAASAIAHDLYVGVVPATGRHPAGAGQRGAHRDRCRSAPRDRHRHRGEGPERRSSRGAGVRRGRVGQFPVRAAHALLAQLQYGRHRAGMIVGTLTAIGLVLVSPNMTYPKAVKATAQNVVNAAPTRQARLAADLAAAPDDAAKGRCKWPSTASRRGRRRQGELRTQV